MEEKNYDKKIIKAKNRARLMLFISAGFLLIAIVLVLGAYYQVNKGQNIPKTLDALKNLSIKLQQSPQKNNKQNFARREIDGVWVSRGKENIYPVALMLDNHPDARPQFGLAQANLVFEAPVEGATTRFMAIYANNENINKIGPIRSARPYFVDWAEEFSAVYAHCGGSPAALAQIIKNNIKDLNEYYNGQYFWRTNLRQRPHNLLTSSDKLKSYLDKKNYLKGTYIPWKFKEDNPPVKNSVASSTKTKIIISDYGVTWKYNASANNYIRYFNKKKYLDAGNNKIKAKNIIIMVIPAKVIDNELRLKMADIGQGNAIACLDKICQSVIWRKKSQFARTRFFDNNNKEFKFNAGPTWIEVIKSRAKVKLLP